MDLGQFESNVRKDICNGIELHSDGSGRYLVLSPFRFDDGDHFVIVLKQEGGRWILSDEGHTFMRLSYFLDDHQIKSPSRQRIITSAINSFGIIERGGELICDITNRGADDAFYSLVQAIMRISSLSAWTRDRVRSTFVDDLGLFLRETVGPKELIYDWHDQQRDPEAMYTADFAVQNVSRWTFIYGLTNDNNTRDATIALRQFDDWNLNYRVMAVFDNKSKINRKVLARFSAVCPTQFSSLKSNKARIAESLLEMIS